MLKDSFYTLISQEGTEVLMEYSIQLNDKHLVFDGHFPGNPVVPGVCMLQIIIELASHTAGSTLQLQKATQVKYLNILNPCTYPKVNVKIERNTENPLKVAASLFSGETVFARLQGVLCKL